MLSQAKRRSANDISYIQLVLGNMRTLPFSDNEFDFILLNHSLEYIADLEAFGREVVRVASQEAGICVITKYAGGAIWRAVQRLSTALRHNPIPHQYWRYPADVVDALKLIRCDVQGIGVRFPNRINDVHDAFHLNEHAQPVLAFGNVSGLHALFLAPLTWHIGIFGFVQK